MVFAKISQVAHYAPDQVISNDDLAEIMDTSDEWIRERTGIRQRHIAAEKETVSRMAAKAAEAALENAGIQAEDCWKNLNYPQKILISSLLLRLHQIA